MRYFIDTEFNGHGGKLISVAVVAEDGREVYLNLFDHLPHAVELDDWVVANVLPVIDGTDEFPVKPTRPLHRGTASVMIGALLLDDPEPIIIADWPADIAHFCDLLITGAGTMVRLPQVQFVYLDHDDFSTAEASLVPHNALFDARALRDFHLQQDAAFEQIVAPLVDMGDGVAGD